MGYAVGKPINNLATLNCTSTMIDTFISRGGHGQKGVLYEEHNQT